MKEETIILKIKEFEHTILKLLVKDNFKKITPTQIKIVKFINENGTKVYQKDIEKHLGFTRATTSGVLKTMEKHGLIEKKNNENDARSKEIVLKDKVKTLFEKSKKQLDNIESIIKKDMTNDEIESFLNTTNKMINNMNKFLSN